MTEKERQARREYRKLFPDKYVLLIDEYVYLDEPHFKIWLHQKLGGMSSED